MKFKYKTVLVLFMSLLSACTKDFEKMQFEPKFSGNTNTEFLMSEVILSTAYAYQENADQQKSGFFLHQIFNAGPQYRL